MNLVRQNLFHIITISLFTGLVVHSWTSPDVLGWTFLFILIMLNAVLFIVYKPITMISWITIVVGILGILMSVPDMVHSGLGYLKTERIPDGRDQFSFQPTCYFAVSALFSYLQILKTFR